MKYKPVTVTAFYPDHLRRLKVHPGQTEEYNVLLSFSGLDNLASCTGLTAWAGDECLGVAGVFPMWPGRAEAWVLFSDNARHYLLQTMERFKYVLGLMPYRRIEMVVKVNNANGHRFAKHLGFGGTQTVELPNGKKVQADGMMLGYWPESMTDTDVVLYSRVKSK